MAYISFQPSDFYNTILYVGNQPADNAITGVGFSPNFVWVKNRDATSSNVLFNTVQGVGKSLYSNDTAAEVSDAAGMKSFDADGFTVGDWSQPNTNGDDYVSWNWKAGTTSGIATNGSTTITPTGYSFNQTSGFSVIAYTGNSTSGAKIPHGLGVAPDLMFVKKLNAGQSWAVYHTAIGPTKYLRLNTTMTEATSIDRWNDTATDSVNFTVGDSGDTNGAFNYLAYCFASIKGYSKFGSYLGNGNADGPMIYTGFRPAFIMVKKATDAGGSYDNWFLHDTKRDTYNVMDKDLVADDNWVEDYGISAVLGDAISNGFKLRTSDTYVNDSGETYVYMAFAEFPFVSSNSIPTVAR